MSPRRRGPRARSHLSVLIWAFCAATVTACVGDSSPAAPASSTTTSIVPEVPAPADGAIRVSIRADRGGDDRTVLFVGDSVLVSIADDLAGAVDATLHIDAVDCRTLADAVDGGCGGVPAGTTIDSGLDALHRSGEVVAASDGARPLDAVVLVLANNATFAPEDLDAAMEAIDVGRIWWVNARIDGFGRQDINNRLLEELVARHPTAGIIDWFGTSRDRVEWFADHVHPNDEGQARLAGLIADHLDCDCVP